MYFFDQMSWCEKAKQTQATTLTGVEAEAGLSVAACLIVHLRQSSDACLGGTAAADAMLALEGKEKTKKPLRLHLPPDISWSLIDELATGSFTLGKSFSVCHGEVDSAVRLASPSARIWGTTPPDPTHTTSPTIGRHELCELSAQAGVHSATSAPVTVFDLSSPFLIALNM